MKLNLKNGQHDRFRGIYYNLNMGPELEAIEAEMNK